MGKRIEAFREQWDRMKNSARFHNVLMFLVFVAIATIFWFIIALNDNVTETFQVKLNIQNVPDSVTFITDPPSTIHVTFRDKGTSILRSGVLKNPAIDLNFRDYARDGIFRLSSADLNAELKSDLSGGIQVASTSIDSLRLLYTTAPGKRVPVVVVADVSPASGYVIAGTPTPITKSVMIYSYGDEIDTVSRVLTQRLVRKDLAKTTSYDVGLTRINGVKIVPSSVKVQVPVEPLVHKEGYAVVEIDNLPDGESLLLFPNRVPVSFYVPMSKFTEEDIPVTAHVNYLDTHRSLSSRIPVTLKGFPPYLVNVELMADSVEYTLVK